MENLTLDENNAAGGGAPQQQQQQQSQTLGPSPHSQQLPPQMFTTAAQLLDMTDKKLMVALRDGRKLIGVLRSWDQFGLYADVPRGIFLVRGENVLLLGEIDLDKDDDPPPGYERAEVELVHRLNTERKAKEAAREKIRLAKLRALGFEGENTAEASL
ncbi:hypothetical protein IFR05_014049 [Cadophora sp. M221]|nr:hypothetical protein IFR05_014049 [Cadophora sp. M221]